MQVTSDAFLIKLSSASSFTAKRSLIAAEISVISNFFDCNAVWNDSVSSEVNLSFERCPTIFPCTVKIELGESLPFHCPEWQQSIFRYQTCLYQPEQSLLHRKIEFTGFLEMRTSFRLSDGLFSNGCKKSSFFFPQSTMMLFLQNTITVSCSS